MKTKFDLLVAGMFLAAMSGAWAIVRAVNVDNASARSDVFDLSGSNPERNGACVIRKESFVQTTISNL